MNRSRLFTSAAAFFMFAAGSSGFSPSVFSQNEPSTASISNSDLASVLEKRVIEKKREEPEPPHAPAPKIEIEQFKVKEAPVSETRFFVKQIRLEGNQVLPAAGLKPLIAPYEAGEWALSDLTRLAQAITKRYHESGFITSLAYIPVQEIRDGTLTIRVIEGKVGNVSVRGSRYFRKRKILSYLSLKQGEVLHVRDIRRTVNRLNQNPDRIVSIQLRPGEAPETTDIILDVEDRFPGHLGFSFDNQGNDSSGKQRFGFIMTDNNLSGQDDSLMVGTAFGREFGFIFSQYAVPLTPANTKLIAGFGHGQVTPKKALKPLGVNSVAQTYSAGLEQPIAALKRFYLSAQAGVDLTESRTLVQAGTYLRERLRLFRFGPRMAVVDPWGETTLVHQCFFGMTLLGATIHADASAARQGTRPAFFYFKENLVRNQRLPFGASANMRVDVQHTTRKLPSQRALYLGGAYSVRGYPEADYSADTGVLSGIEIFLPTLMFPKDWRLPYAGIPLRDQIAVVTFVDQGYGRLRGPSGLETASRHLLGVGGGLRIRLYRALSARIEWARALGDHPLTDSSRSQFYFRLQLEK